MELFTVENLTFRYPETAQNALNSVTFSLSAGEFAVLCGESGCGKSTLLRLLKREIAPFGEQTGSILYSGTELSSLDPRTAASEIGFVLQNPDSQIVTDTVWHELAFGLESLGFSMPVIRRRVAEMAGYFGIETWFHKKTSELSGGQKQLLNLASVMAMQPKILLLDEPTAQLDPIAAANFIATLHKLNRELGLTILLVEHRLEEVFPIADRVLLLDSGKLLLADHPKQLHSYFQTHPNHPMLAGLPASMRLFGLLNETGDCPLTVREGKQFLTAHYRNETDSLPTVPDQPTGDTVLELTDVWFRYEKNTPDILKGVSLTVHRGEHFCILGGNGAGKTTALQVIAGLRKAYRGKIKLNGRKISEIPAVSLYRNNLALLPQNPQTVFLEKTVREDLAEVCKAMHLPAAETESALSDVCEKLCISHLLDMHPYDLSGGEQQKAALAKMLLLRPQILLLDEPTKGVDAYSRQTFAAILRQLQADGITVLTVTHDVEFAAATATRCGMFFDGELISVDTPTAFFSENHFYTTAANRIARGFYRNAVLCEQIAELCRINGRKEVTDRA